MAALQQILLAIGAWEPPNNFPTPTLVGGGEYFYYNGSSFSGPSAAAIVSPGSVTLYVSASGETWRGSGVYITPQISTSGSYTFVFSVLSTEGGCSGGSWNITVTPSTGAFYIAPVTGGCYARGWYASDYLQAVRFDDLYISGNKAYMTISLGYVGPPVDSGTVDKNGQPIYVPGPLRYLTRTFEFAKTV